MARDSDSYIFRKGVTPNTLSVISSKNRIYAHNTQRELVQLGVVATFDPSEARTIEPVRGIGFGDHIAELVPGVTDPMTISITRTALYLSNIYQIFGYNSGIDGIARSLKHHRWPFDIRQEVVFSALAHRAASGLTPLTGDFNTVVEPVEPGGTGDGHEKSEYSLSAVLTFYEACWISDYSVSYASDAALVQETVTINVSDIIADIEATDNFTEQLPEPYSILDSGVSMSNKLRPPTVTSTDG
jgi:hypothetical protein